MIKLYKDVPAVQEVDWEVLFKSDPRILGDIINDVIKIAVSEKGRPGKRSASSADDITDDLRKLNKQDYSELLFKIVLKKQMHARSFRQVAARSGLSKSVIHRFTTGESEPTFKQLEKLAVAFNKSPGYFLEYRAAYVCEILFQLLIDNPSLSIVQYEKLKGL